MNISPIKSLPEKAKIAFSKIKILFDNAKNNFLAAKEKGWPKSHQWSQIFRILEKREKIWLSVLLIFFLASGIFLLRGVYYKYTVIKPANGGTYTEGILGRPRFINPIYASANDADRDLTELIFSGLTKYDPNGKLVMDLADKYEIKENGTIYEFTLKNNILWHDEKKFSADDVVYTIKTIQDPSYKSPLRTNWLGVEVEKIGENSVRFALKNPYPAFLANTTLKILPKHIWESIPAQNFPLAIFNLQPIGTGPYRYNGLSQDKLGYVKSLSVKVFSKYFGKKPHISSINFNYYETEEAAIAAAKRGEVHGLAFLSPKNFKALNGSVSIQHLSLPRYFALFLNPAQSALLADKNVRLALNYGTNKEDIVNKALLSGGKIVESPILPDIYGFSAPTKTYAFDSAQANALLDKTGYKDTNSDGIREKKVDNSKNATFKSNLQSGSQGAEVKELQKCLAKFPDIYPSGDVAGVFGENTKAAVIKFQEKYADEILKPSNLTKGNGLVKQGTRDKLNELCGEPLKDTDPLKFTLVTVDQPQLLSVANEIKQQWKNLGINLEIRALSISALQQDYIKPRSFEILLFGEVLGSMPDPFSFWHSSQAKDPGLNLTGYSNKDVDKLLEEARQSQNGDTKTKDYEKIQNLIINDAPVVFLYNPDYLYPISKNIKGIDTKFIVDPSQRFSNIENWYINTRRGLK